jgi:hypothetical protein
VHRHRHGPSKLLDPIVLAEGSDWGSALVALGDGLSAVVTMEIGHEFTVRLAGLFQGLAGDIEKPTTVGTTTSYGDPTYGTCDFEFMS